MSIDPKDFKFDKSLVKLFSSKRYDECFEGCKKKLIKDPLDLQALLYMANISLDRRELDDCIHYCDTIIQGVEAGQQSNCPCPFYPAEEG